MSDRYVVEDVVSIRDPMIAVETVFDAASERRPETRLMAAVLKDALHHFRTTVHATNGRSRRLYIDAQEWFASRDPEPLFSFENICSALGVNSRHIRRSLFAWRDAERARVHAAAEATARPDPVAFSFNTAARTEHGRAA